MSTSESEAGAGLELGVAVIGEAVFAGGVKSADALGQAAGTGAVSVFGEAVRAAGAGTGVRLDALAQTGAHAQTGVHARPAAAACAQRKRCLQCCAAPRYPEKRHADSTSSPH